MKAIFALAWRVFLVLVLAAGVELVTVPLREVSADSQTEVFNVSGTYNWTVPEGVTNITVEAWGAGGAGGGSVSINCTGSAGGGGGGGAYATSNLTVTPGDILFVVVGGGGTGVTGGNGTDGGASFVGNNTIASDAFVLAAGGKGGAANTAENQTAPGGAGGSIVDSTGQYILAGEAGGFGGEGWNITSGAGGKCAGPGGGSGGKGVDPSSDNATREGYPGYPPGGGGGGGRTSDVGEPQSGGRGGDGKVVITWESPPPPEQYCLTMAVSPYPCAGNTTPSGTTCYAANTSVNITALAAPCWQFANWTATAGTFGDPNAANTTYTMPAQNVNVTANFVPLVVYNLTINSTDCGSVTMPREGTFPYDPCEQVHLLASPEAGCQFTGWTATAGGFTNPNAAETYFIMPCENATVTAHFKPVTPPSYPPCTPSYGLMIYSTEGGSVTSPGEGAFPYIGGYVVSLVATPDPGYRFARWTGDVGTIADVYAASTTIHMDNWYIITANFERLIPRYSLTTSSTSGGSVTNPGEGTFTYDDGAVVTLVASANSGYKFVNWTGDVATVANVNAASTTVTMRGNYSIAANFEEIHEYSLTISAGPGGSVINPGLGTFSYAAGSTVNLVAMANSGYNFQNWTGDVATVANVNSATTTITMNGDYSVRANFKEATGAGPSVPSAGGCFIATAAYGTPTAEQIDVLREFRDVVLLRSTPGSRFVSLYYRLSPPVANFIAGHEVLRTVVRKALIDPIVRIVEATGTVWGD